MSVTIKNWIIIDVYMLPIYCASLVIIVFFKQLDYYFPLKSRPEHPIHIDMTKHHSSHF